MNQTRVLIGLKQSHLNGTHVTVIRKQHERFVVEVSPKGGDMPFQIAVKPQNLAELHETLLQQAARTIGLKHAMSH